MTTNELVDSIRNSVTSGLQGVGNHNLSSKLVLKDAIALRNELIKKKELNGILNVDSFVQTIDAILLDNKPMSNHQTIHSIKTYKHCEIPRLVLGQISDNIVHIGDIDKSDSIPFQLGKNYKSFKYRPVSGSSPFIWISTSPNENDNFDCWFISSEYFRPLKYLSITAIFEDPIAVDEIKKLGAKIGVGPNQKDSREFPAPEECQSQIIKELTSRYVQLFIKRNTPVMAQDGLKN